MTQMIGARSVVSKPNGPTVLLVTPNLDIGGAQATVRLLASWLPRVGCPTIVCSFADGPLRSDIEGNGVRVELLGERRHRIAALPAFLGEMRRYRRRLGTLIAEHGVDVVQTQGLGTLDFLVMTVRRRRGPQVWWTIQNASFELRPEHVSHRRWSFELKRAAHRALYRFGARRVDGVIAVSDDTASAFDAVTGRAGRTVVVCNAVDVDRFPAAVDRERARRDLGIGADEHVMTMVGTFKRQKGHRYLVEAMASIAADRPDLRLLMVGDGELRGDIERDIAARGLADRIEVLGTRRDVPELLAMSDSFVLPSLWEGLPLALVEAMASRLPVIATAVSGTNQVVVNGVSGLLVQPGDASALAEAMRTVVGEPETAAALADAGRNRVASMFGAESQAEQLATLFRARRRGEVDPTPPLDHGTDRPVRAT
jgi:glycosyltransferase involved in cell wall biosynthesis